MPGKSPEDVQMNGMARDGPSDTGLETEAPSDIDPMRMSKEETICFCET